MSQADSTHQGPLSDLFSLWHQDDPPACSRLHEESGSQLETFAMGTKRKPEAAPDFSELGSLDDGIRAQQTSRTWGE